MIEYWPLVYCWLLIDMMEFNGVMSKLIVDTLVECTISMDMIISIRSTFSIMHKRTHLLRKNIWTGVSVSLFCICLYYIIFCGCFLKSFGCEMV